MAHLLVGWDCFELRGREEFPGPYTSKEGETDTLGGVEGLLEKNWARRPSPRNELRKVQWNF